MITAQSKATDSVLSLRCNISEQKDNHTLVMLRAISSSLNSPSLPKNTTQWKLSFPISCHLIIDATPARPKLAPKLPDNIGIIQLLSVHFHNYIVYIVYIVIQLLMYCFVLCLNFYPHIYLVRSRAYYVNLYVNLYHTVCAEGIRAFGYISNVPSTRAFFIGGSALFVDGGA